MTILNTCSSVISLSKQLEADSAAFYEVLAQVESPTGPDRLRQYANENSKTSKNIERTYFGVITDALEGCFAFNLDESKYIINTKLPGGVRFADAVRQAITMEEVISQFYSDAADQSKATMADIPRLFVQISKKRIQRIGELRSLIE